jgi:hypothetical protein
MVSTRAVLSMFDGHAPVAGYDDFIAEGVDRATIGRYARMGW